MKLRRFLAIVLMFAGISLGDHGYISMGGHKCY